ncbi:hypothetical protein HYPSUDRAFT_40926 [Hypholoma sublateritium FD-334 SS-4]|uniref:Uncharacterized protein n=1 Tax=Hypholoma sublateritium (strain FD-334 SS-4) TaxID=945553 RepID=A0A0D2MG00_HYPSF|nr:hypothetical protein HYPSUDRAFT_40926 [Hypholoma sublateritium FD-334 SS-4]
MTTQPTPAHLLAFPSVSSSLHTLPQATSIHSVALHPGMYAPAPRAAESAAKLNKALALSRSASSTATLPAFRAPPALPPPTSGEDPAQLTIRTKSRFAS